MSRISVAVCGCVLWLAACQETDACDCVGLTPAAAYSTAQAVISGRVVSIANTQGFFTVTISVVHCWKGGLAGEVLVRTGAGGGGCGVAFLMDSTYVVYTYRDPTYASSGQDSNWTNICMRTATLSDARTDLQYLATTAIPVAGVSRTVPGSIVLERNFPNPFNPSTMIRYGLPRSSHVSLVVINMLGQLVATLEDGWEEAGYHTARFDAKGLASGVYFYRLTTAETVTMQACLLLR